MIFKLYSLTQNVIKSYTTFLKELNIFASNLMVLLENFVQEIMSLWRAFLFHLLLTTRKVFLSKSVPMTLHNLLAEFRMTRLAPDYYKKNGKCLAELYPNYFYYCRLIFSKSILLSHSPFHSAIINYLTIDKPLTASVNG